jgi:hypothetical protein
MCKRQAVLATLKHEEPEIIPNRTTFFSINGIRKLVPHFSEEPRKDTLKRLEFLDNFMVEVGCYGLHQEATMKYYP